MLRERRDYVNWRVNAERRGAVPLLPPPRRRGSALPPPRGRLRAPGFLASTLRPPARLPLAYSARHGRERATVRMCGEIPIYRLAQLKRERDEAQTRGVIAFDARIRAQRKRNYGCSDTGDTCAYQKERWGVYKYVRAMRFSRLSSQSISRVVESALRRKSAGRIFSRRIRKQHFPSKILLGNTIKFLAECIDFEDTTDTLTVYL